MVECLICGAEVTKPGDAVVGELIVCADCGTELEITGLDPFTIEEAPQVQEDWGE
jgi:alpha-aminoadipate/glutamate carrier protein LysW